MQVVSINVANPTEIPYHGQMVTTGIFKRPSKDGVLVRTGNLEGDAQADLVNHGGEDKAVYAFSNDDYLYWQVQLNNPELGPGAFGENLTVSNFDESVLCIGDRFRIGGCVLEISQPRVPCFKLGIALNNVRAPKLFTKHFHTGAYLRVIEEGLIEPGNELVKIHGPAIAVSVESLFSAYFDKACVGAEATLTKTLGVEELAAEWREKLEKRVPLADSLNTPPNTL